MDKRTFGRSGLKLSALGFGCGAVGGLMVRGTATDQERAFARALDTGINYFDTASQYGDGESEKNLGRLIRQLKPRDITFGTKVRLRPADLNNIRDAITASLAASLARLQLPQVDVFHLHNPIGGSEPGALTTDQVLNEVVPTFDTLKQQGKIRFCGLTAVGETAAIQQVVASGRIDSAQVLFNLLNPSASSALPKNYPGQDFRALLKVNASAGTGSIAIRILGGGALSGTANRQANASPAPRPIGSADTFDGDLARAQRFAPLVRDGLASSLTELAIRFAITERDVGTALIGLASQSDLDAAIAAVEKGPLPQSVLAQISAVQASFAAEA
jgi:L-galactose dehydrogenase/L-glyceraldehyde 3-phosphate reductase